VRSHLLELGVVGVGQEAAPVVQLHLLSPSASEGTRQRRRWGNKRQKRPTTTRQTKRKQTDGHCIPPHLALVLLQFDAMLLEDKGQLSGVLRQHHDTRLRAKIEKKKRTKKNETRTNTNHKLRPHLKLNP
jgi:hypothetical protein